MNTIIKAGRRTVLKAGTAAVTFAGFAPHVHAQPATSIRIAVIGSSGQAELTTAIEKYGLDKKHGIAVEPTDYAAPGQQYTLFRAGTIDVAIGNFVDLHRQRRAGVAIKAFHGYQSYSNSVVVKASSPITQFGELRGRKMGSFGNTFLDWLVLRAAGKKAYGLDIELDAKSVMAAPPLLNQLLMKDEIDAAIQFSSLSIGPITLGEQRPVTDLRTLMQAAGLNPDAFYTHWFVSEDWLRRNPGAIGRVHAMFAEGYERLMSDDEIWSVLAQRIRITDATIVDAYRRKGRLIDNPPYRQDLLQPTQTLLGEIASLAGEQATGVSTLDQAAFLFPA
jgi:NitT/TauT family transport system substrate-binding protein